MRKYIEKMFDERIKDYKRFLQNSITFLPKAYDKTAVANSIEKWKAKISEAEKYREKFLNEVIV